MGLRLTVLCENSVSGPFGLIGEHGWSVLVETEDLSLLFDTGQGQGIENNSRILRRPLSSVDCIVLSHGHYDHTGGLPACLLSAGKMPVYAHPDIFLERWWRNRETSRYIGIRYRRSFLESLGADFHLHAGFQQIAPGIHIISQIPRVTDFELPDPNMMIRDGSGNWVQDELNDDLSLVADSSEGLVVLLGCAHAGIINILTHVRDRFPSRPIHTVMGGTHLGFATEEQFEKTMHHLSAFEVQHLGASHCTGLERASMLQAALGNRFFHASVGTVLEI